MGNVFSWTGKGIWFMVTRVLHVPSSPPPFRQYLLLAHFAFRSRPIHFSITKESNPRSRCHNLHILFFCPFSVVSSVKPFSLPQIGQSPFLCISHFVSFLRRRNLKSPSSKKFKIAVTHSLILVPDAISICPLPIQAGRITSTHKRKMIHKLLLGFFVMQ